MDRDIAVMLWTIVVPAVLWILLLLSAMWRDAVRIRDDPSVPVRPHPQTTPRPQEMVMRMDHLVEVTRDMVVFRNATGHNIAVGADIVPSDGVRTLHIELFRRYVSRELVDRGHIEIIDDPSSWGHRMPDGTSRPMASTTCETREAASYLEVFGDLPPESSEAAPPAASPRPRRKTDKRTRGPRPTELEW